MDRQMDKQTDRLSYRDAFQIHASLKKMICLTCNHNEYIIYVSYNSCNCIQTLMCVHECQKAHLHIAVNYDFVQLRIGVISNINKYIVNVLEYI